MEEKPRSLDTLGIHADQGLEAVPDIAPPLHVSTTFRIDNPEGLTYAREHQVTRGRLEAVLGALEGGHAVVYASGQAASLAALLHLKPRRVAIAAGGYHGSRALLGQASPWNGIIETIGLEAGLQSGDLVWLETPRNPTCEIDDIASHVARARAAGARVIVDSTLATPILQRPLDWGADLVMHSATKFLAGHSDAMGGVLVAREAASAERLRQERTLFGSVLGALETWLILRGIRTLGVRVRRQTETATRLAEWLEGRVARLWHPSRPSHPGHATAKRQMRGPGAIVSLELASEAAARALPGKLRLFQHATSLGGVESLIDWRRRHDPTAPPGLLRLSVGLEDPDELIADLEQALGKM